MASAQKTEQAAEGSVTLSAGEYNALLARLDRLEAANSTGEKLAHLAAETAELVAEVKDAKHVAYQRSRQKLADKIASLDESIAAAKAALFNGPKKYRVAIRQPDEHRGFFSTIAKGTIVNREAIVGATSKGEAQEKYSAYFGIVRTRNDWSIVELSDEEARTITDPLPPIGRAAHLAAVAS